MNCILMSFRLTFTYWINLHFFINLSGCPTDGFKWISRPSNKTLAHVGSTVHITWHYNCSHRFGSSDIYYNGAPMFYRYGNGKKYVQYTAILDVHFSVSGESNVTIIIPDVDIDKRGSYCCGVKCVGVAGIYEKCTTLVIYALPRINYLTSNPHGKQGDSISLKCYASGDPAPNVTWIHKDRTIAQSYVTSFNITGKASGGKYCCHVSNNFGNETNCTTLDVTEYQPINIEMTSNVKFSTANNTFQVSCKADASPPATYLIQQGHKMIVNSSDGNVTVTTPNNGSSLNMSCAAKNKYGEGKVAYLQILIYQPPTIVEILPNTSITLKAKNITLQCIAIGIPTPVITWYDAISNEVVANGTLHVKNDDCKSKTLLYYCNASNVVGNAKSPDITVKVVSFCVKEENKKNGDNRLQLIIVVIVCTLLIVVLTLVIILIKRRRTHSKRDIKGTQKQDRREIQVLEESPYGEPVDAIQVRTYASASNADYATVEETGYKRVITNHHLPAEPQHNKTSSSKKGKPYVEPVYAKVNKKNKKKDKSPDIPMNPLYDEIPRNMPNSKHQPTQPRPETSANNKNSNEEEDEVDSGQGSWFSWAY